MELPICEKTKVITNAKVLMQISSLSESHFDRAFIVCVEPIPAGTGGHSYIFNACCDQAKQLAAAPTRVCSALSATNCLLEHIICRNNIPPRVVSGNATCFMSRATEELVNPFAKKKIFTTSYSPLSNVAGRSHKNAECMFANNHGNRRHPMVRTFEFATFVYNNTGR